MNNIKLWPVLALSALACLPTLAAAQSNAARASTGAGAPATLSAEVEKLGNAASNGDAEAQYKLAQRYARGDGVPRSTETAMLWLTKAAEQGHLTAQATLGTNYLLGEGARKDVATAIQWLTRAAAQGDPMAQTNLGALYLNGDGAPQNFRLALQWLEKAAAQASPLAQYSLGKMYQYGYGVRTDETAAAQWYNKAAKQNYLPAREALAELGKSAGTDKSLAAAMALPATVKPQTAAPLSTGPADKERDSVLGAIQGWAAAWSGKRTDAYLGYYANSFVPAGGESRDAWAAQRRLRIDGKRRIAVSVESPQIEVRGSSASVVFRQKYASDGFSEDSTKKLILVRDGDGWKIQQEVSEKLPRTGTSR